MKKQTLFLGIESSCDETAAAIVGMDEGGRGEIIADLVFSQLEEHAAFGGVVPEIAARAHVEAMDGLIAGALEEAGIGFTDLDGIAATIGPGLIGGLITGAMSGKAIAYAADKPFYGINHLEGHALTARLTDNVAFPFLMLLVSGGHTQIVLVKGVGDYERWGSTIDDALGEAFDKTAKLLGLGYPGGPAVERAAVKGDPKRIRLPRPMKGEDRLDFSFSGLKTAVRQAAQALAPVSEQDVADICAAFQLAVTDTLEDRIARALKRFQAEGYSDDVAPALVVAGGVAANGAIRAMLTGLCAREGFTFVAPPLRLCTDNAVMIAWAGLERRRIGLEPDDTEISVRSRFPLDGNAAALIGSGRRGVKA